MNNPMYGRLRIALSAALLRQGHFYMLGLPEPQSVRYSGYSTAVSLITGGQARAGFRQAVVMWTALIADAAHVLNELVDTAESSAGEGNGTLYLTIPKTDASASGVGWIDISGVVIRPQFVPVEGTYGKLYQNVSLVLTNVTLVNDPSEVS